MVDDFPARRLIQWYESQQRDLPWRRTDDPYHIWVSEIMLQQTQVDTVIPYYHRFLSRFPDIESLAKADRQQVLKSWEGLGYYSRARNLQDAARTVMEKFNGKLPDSIDDLRSLKGIGPYTSAAISSIAWQQPYAAVDGNVIRVLSRYFGITDDTRSSRTQRQIQELADQCLDEERPGDYNQAVMELGAMVCRPKNPECGECPLSAGCIAYKMAATDQIPYKSPTREVPHHQVVVGLIVRDDGKLLIALRPEEKMLGGLWEFPGGKQRDGEDLRGALKRELKEELGVDTEVGPRFMSLRHAYSHFRITLHAFWCRLSHGGQKPEPLTSSEIRFVEVGDLDHYPFPQANRRLIDKLTNGGLAADLQKPVTS